MIAVQVDMAGAEVGMVKVEAGMVGVWVEMVEGRIDTLEAPAGKEGPLEPDRLLNPVKEQTDRK